MRKTQEVPPQAEIQGEAGTEAEVVLDEKDAVRVAEIALRIASARLEIGDAALQKVRESAVAIGGIVKAERAANGELVRTIQLVAGGFAAGANRVFSGDERPSVAIVE